MSEKHRERRSYIIGYVLSLILTLPVLALAGFQVLPRHTVLWIAGAAALIQIAVHFRFFLHIRLRGQTREDLQLILFTALIMILMCGGTIWILADLDQRM